MATVTESVVNSERWKYSTFFITLNTNQRNYDRGKLRNVLRKLFESDEMFHAILDGENVETVDMGYSTVQFGVELGPKTGYVHAHVLVKIRHHGHLKINIGLLRVVLEKSLGLVGVHLDVKGMGNSNLTLVEYLGKKPAL